MPGRETSQATAAEATAAEASAAVDEKSLSRQNLSEAADKILQNLPGEPTLEQLEDAALRFADADEQRSRGWRRAPNLSSLLPVFKIAVNHDLERDETLDRRQDEPDIWGADTDRDWGFQLSAQWHLSQLIFHSDEIRVWSALADRASRREAVLALLVGYYFERRRAQVRLLAEPPQTIAEMVELKMRLAELTASIDSLTGGALSAGLKGKNQ